MREGDNVLIDAGAEVGRYASDITRTYRAGPKEGFFRDLYQVVLNGQVKGIQRCRTGAEWREVHLAVARDLAEGLVALGILRGAPDSLVEAAQFLLGEDVSEREHRPVVHDFTEGARGLGANALRWRVGRNQVRKSGLHRHQLAHELVVFRVGDLRRVVLVVQLAGAPERGHQFGVPEPGRGGAKAPGRLDGLVRNR